MESISGTERKEVLRKEVLRKEVLRRERLALRDALPEDARQQMDRQRWRLLAEHPLYRQAERIFTYVSYRSEADTRSLIACALESGRQVAVPRVREREMDFFVIRGMGDLSEGFRGIPEPRGTEDSLAVPSAHSRDLMILPGAAFDRRGGRIGYGGGFYDRFLSKYPHAATLALAYEVQVADSIPMQAHDIRVDALLTEEGFTFIQEGGLHQWQYRSGMKNYRR